jgi:hypothetical protein
MWLCLDPMWKLKRALTQCRNDNSKLYSVANEKLKIWDGVFLEDAVKRLNPLMEGYDVTVRDVKDFMEVSPTCGERAP